MIEYSVFETGEPMETYLFWRCNECATLVADADVHTEWHERLVISL